MKPPLYIPYFNIPHQGTSQDFARFTQQEEARKRQEKLKRALASVIPLGGKVTIEHKSGAREEFEV